jgi:peptidoglycan/xylan/chitin deacetylase (PgdA/CDA1 family)
MNYVLTFHGLGSPERGLPAGEDRYWVTVSFFEAILDRVRDHPEVSITFDDSNSSDCRIALPALLRRQMKAVFFMVSERLDLPGFVSTEQMKELRNAGMGIGSHGTHHRPWATLKGPELTGELTGSRARLEGLLGQPVTQAACPFGSYNRRVLRGARAAGYVKVFTSDQGPANPRSWPTPRNTITKDHDLGFVDKLIRTRPGGFKRVARSFKLTLKRLR